MNLMGIKQSAQFYTKVDSLVSRAFSNLLINLISFYLPFFRVFISTSTSEMSDQSSLTISSFSDSETFDRSSTLIISDSDTSDHSSQFLVSALSVSLLDSLL